MLRFASFTRVSTERQEKRGESLATQAKQIEEAVAKLGGTITAKFGGGAEHGTIGFDREQYDSMLAAAERKPCPFDAVMVQHEDRWSRDDTTSLADLERLKNAGVRFFVLGLEKNIGDATVRLCIGLSSLIGAYQARTQAQKSMLNRLERARRGIPTGGSLPFGRTFTWDDPKTRQSGKWGIDDGKRQMIADIARRFLAGESLIDLAAEHGSNHSNLCKLLRKRCGPTWDIEFDVEVLGIEEKTVTVAWDVPPLLADDIIKQCCLRLDARRTYLHQTPRPVNTYALSGRVFCAACGYLMTGQKHSTRGHLYYRHAHKTPNERRRTCPLGKPEPWVRADILEHSVLTDLLHICGNPAALERACRAAMPDTTGEEGKRDDLEGRLAGVNQRIDNVVVAIEEKTLTREEAAARMGRLREQKATIQAALDRVNDLLAETPTPEELRLYIDKIAGLWTVSTDLGEDWQAGMEKCYETALDLVSLDRLHDKAKLLDAAFGSPLPGGQPAGVYIHSSVGVKPREYKYQLRGRLLPDAVVMLRGGH
jgi:DNA invertase Pin-like site-specific DNA recombinase